MIKETTLFFDGIDLKMWDQVVHLFPIEYTYATFPSHFCGAGTGLNELAVPDYIFGSTRLLAFLGFDISIKISPACFIHDKEWQLANPTWEDFHVSNARLHQNIESIIHTKARNEWVKARALYRPVTYLNAVSLAGRGVFWNLKIEEGHCIPEDAMAYVHSRHRRKADGKDRRKTT